MSLPCPSSLRLSFAATLLWALVGCQRSDAQALNVPDASGNHPTVAVTTLFPGGGTPPPENLVGKLYEGNAGHIAAGKRYFSWYNCAGCHANGGGAIGPALMDSSWIYGGRIDQIYDTLIEGRPNGMPSWRGKIPEDQLWEIAAYVKSLSAANPVPDQPGVKPATIMPPAPVEQTPADWNGHTLPAKR